jgi:hypothetical protein
MRSCAVPFSIVIPCTFFVCIVFDCRFVRACCLACTCSARRNVLVFITLSRTRVFTHPVSTCTPTHAQVVGSRMRFMASQLKRNLRIIGLAGVPHSTLVLHALHGIAFTHLLILRTFTYSTRILFPHLRHLWPTQPSLTPHVFYFHTYGICGQLNPHLLHTYSISTLTASVANAILTYSTHVSLAHLQHLWPTQRTWEAGLASPVKTCSTSTRTFVLSASRLTFRDSTSATRLRVSRRCSAQRTTPSRRTHLTLPSSCLCPRGSRRSTRLLTSCLRPWPTDASRGALPPTRCLLITFSLLRCRAPG